jgi:hypothetical protein
MSYVGAALRSKSHAARAAIRSHRLGPEAAAPLRASDVVYSPHPLASFLKSMTGHSAPQDADAVQRLRTMAEAVNALEAALRESHSGNFGCTWPVMRLH